MVLRLRYETPWTIIYPSIRHTIKDGYTGPSEVRPSIRRLNNFLALEREWVMILSSGAFPAVRRQTSNRATILTTSVITKSISASSIRLDSAGRWPPRNCWRWCWVWSFRVRIATVLCCGVADYHDHGHRLSQGAAEAQYHRPDQPGAAVGQYARDTVSQRVAPSASMASRCVFGTARNTSRLMEVIMGIIIMDSIMAAARKPNPKGGSPGKKGENPDGCRASFRYDSSQTAPARKAPTARQSHWGWLQAFQ